MIQELRIRGLGVIVEAIVPFGSGFTVLTGETGAGKTMVLTGLGLIMGQKADADLVRTGAQRAEVDGEWLLPEVPDPDLMARLEDGGIGVEDDGGRAILLLGRSVAAEGRSRAVAGGRSVPASTLGELTERLIAVHGQSDQVLLREPRRQRELLDVFGGPQLASVRGAFEADFAAWRAADRRLRELAAHREEQDREAERLRHGLAEIIAVQPGAGEDDALKAQAVVLAHATDLLSEVGAAHDALVGGDDHSGNEPVSQLLSAARRSVERARTLDDTLGPAVAQLDAIIVAVDLAAGELSEYARGIDADPARQAEVEERRQLINGLKRRYGPGLDDVIQWWAAAQRTVEEADAADDRMAELGEAAATLRERVLAGAAELTKARGAAAERFGAAVTEELRALAMPDALVAVDVQTTPDPEQFTADGADTVAMMLRPHAGSGLRPLGKGASGGELSRIMLAIEVVLAGVNPVSTFVFDEVDAGVGGKVAVEVGRRLARLARSAQVIVVTHLPQVAAFADQHVLVTKDEADRVTSASVCVVTGPERVRELVRMLSGLEDSQSGADHATELLALAANDRGGS